MIFAHMKCRFVWVMAKKRSWSLITKSQNSSIRIIRWLSAMFYSNSMRLPNGAWKILVRGLRSPGSDQFQYTTRPDKKWDRTTSSVWQKMECSFWRTLEGVVEPGLWDIAELLWREEWYTEVLRSNFLRNKVFIWIYHIDSWVSAGLFPNVSKKWKKTHCCFGGLPEKLQ